MLNLKAQTLNFVLDYTFRQVCQQENWVEEQIGLHHCWIPKSTWVVLVSVTSILRK